MGATTRQIEQHIEETRVTLGSNLDELEQRVKAAADWKHHFRTKPISFLGLALGGGALLAVIVGGRNNRRTPHRLSMAGSAGPDIGHRDARVARQVWNNVKGAIIASASTRILAYAGEVFGGGARKS